MSKLISDCDGTSGLSVLSDDHLLFGDSFLTPMSFYGGRVVLNIDYISDMHLLQNWKNCKQELSLKCFINAVVRQLYDTMRENSVIVFGGDVSSDAVVTLDFYKSFVRYFDYLMFKEKKSKFLWLQENRAVFESTKSSFLSRLVRFRAYIDKLSFQFSVCNAKDERRVILTKMRKAKYRLACVERAYEVFLNDYNVLCDKVMHYERLCGMSIDNISFSDVYVHHLLSDDRHILVVLGNHEYVGFSSVHDALSFYDVALKNLGIRLLKNDCFELDILGRNFVIFGGTGFSRYNEAYNADVLCGCDGFTRDMEVEQATVFYEEYQFFKHMAFNRNSVFICISHYPVHDWMLRCDFDVIYFYGHNHQNYRRRDEFEVVYADNQVGYKGGNFVFKSMSTGCERNPYFGLCDGIHETNVSDYLQFYRYIGEGLGDGKLLNKRCENPSVKMYVLKFSGYYGFFLVNQHGVSKGISIVNGGMTNKITSSVDLEWLWASFCVILSKYLKLFTPFRVFQERISTELKHLGLWGRIHGCIVDVDFHHHIMLNPLDGTVTFYYSSQFGLVEKLLSFDAVVLSMKQKKVSDVDYDFVLATYVAMKNDNCLLSRISNSYLLDGDCRKSCLGLEEVSCSDGMYGVSRKVNAVQRLFTGHVLRVFDLNLLNMNFDISGDFGLIDG